MARYIDADKLVAELQKKPIHDGHFIHTRDVSDAIFYAPTLSPDEARGVASWIPHGDCGVTECSACKWSIEEYVEYNYCPSCGARMKGASGDA